MKKKPKKNYLKNEKKIRMLRRIRELSILCLLLAMFSFYSFAQDQKTVISLQFENARLGQIFEAIEKQSNWNFLYSNDLLKNKPLVSVSIKSSAINEILSVCLKGQNLEAEFKEGNVILIKSKVKKHYTIKGKVYDDKDEPLPGATIIIESLSTGGATDGDGAFTLKSSISKGNLLVSCIGFKSEKVSFNSGKDIIVYLKEDVQSIDEVTVIAYGKRATKEVVGAISGIKAADIEDIPSPSVENLLQSQVAGVEVSNISGTPGAGGTRVNIRGYSSLLQDGISDGSPLYVIDGVPVQSKTSLITGTNMLAGLDPSTIESVELLKDAASAALYGSRASSGVILITTKKGKVGKAQFSAKVSYSHSILPETPTQLIGKAERDWFLKAAKKHRAADYDWYTGNIVIPKSYKDLYGKSFGSYDYLWNRGEINSYFSIPQALQDSINPFYNNSTNWWKYFFRPGKILNANIQASGGVENFKYMVAAGVYDEEGIMLNSSFSRINLTSNMDIKLRQNMDMYARINLSYTNKQGGTDRGSRQGLTVDPKSTPSILPGEGTVAEKEATKALRETDSKNTMINLRAIVGLNYKVLKGLKLSSNISADFYQSKRNEFIPSFLDYNNFSKSSAQIGNYITIQNENLLNYSFNIKNKHNFDLLGGLSYMRQEADSYIGSGKGGPSNSIHYIDEAWPKLKEVYGSITAMKEFLSNYEEQVMVSFFGRLTYDYKKRYLAEFSIRRDGSSVFGEDVRWGTFPAAAIGWIFSKEKFMKDFWWLSHGKLRLSWGRSGKKFDKAYLAHGLMTSSNIFFGKLGLVPQAIMNTGLTWEKSDQYDIGLDVDLMDYRYKLKFDYYYKLSSSLLMTAPLPGDVYFLDNAWNNLAEISNEGVELEFAADVLRDSEAKWNLNFNISRNWNKFKKSVNGIDLPEKVIGRPLFGIYTYKHDGFIHNESEVPYYYDQEGNKKPLYFENEEYPIRPGMRKIKDFNADGVIDQSDSYYAGSALPEAYGGISNRLQWKNFDLNILLSYTIGRKMMNLVAGSSLGFNKSMGVIMKDYSNYSFWEKEGDSTNQPTLEAADISYKGQFDGDIDSNIEKVNYLRMKQLTLGYNLPKRWMQKIGITKTRLYFSAENLFLLTNYSGLDPEIVNPETGKDRGEMYPLARKLTLGLILNF